jgi:hypothetical protein
MATARIGIASLRRQPDHGGMTTPAAMVPLVPTRIRVIGLVTLSLIFALSVLKLSTPTFAPTDRAGTHCEHSVSATCVAQPQADHDTTDLWRGLALGSLYLVFCLRPRRRDSTSPQKRRS